MANFTDIVELLQQFDFDGSGNLKSTASLSGNVTIDLASTNALLTTIDADTSGLFTTISGGKVLTTETSAAATKVAAEALAALIVGGEFLSTETNSGSIKTAVEALAAIITTGKLGVADASAAALAAIISGGKLLTTETSASAIKIDLDTLNTAAYAKKKVLTAAGTQTGNGTVSVSGTAVQVTNLSDTAGMSFTVGGITVTLDVNEQSPVFDTAAFTEIVFAQSSGMVSSYKVLS